MADIKKIFVCKRKGFDIEAKHLMDDLKTTVGISSIED